MAGGRFGRPRGAAEDGDVEGLACVVRVEGPDYSQGERGVLARDLAKQRSTFLCGVQGDGAGVLSSTVGLCRLGDDGLIPVGLG